MTVITPPSIDWRTLMGPPSEDVLHAVRVAFSAAHTPVGALLVTDMPLEFNESRATALAGVRAVAHHADDEATRPQVTHALASAGLGTDVPLAKKGGAAMRSATFAVTRQLDLLVRGPAEDAPAASCDSGARACASRDATPASIAHECSAAMATMVGFMARAVLRVAQGCDELLALRTPSAAATTGVHTGGTEGPPPAVTRVPDAAGPASGSHGGVSHAGVPEPPSSSALCPLASLGAVLRGGGSGKARLIHYRAGEHGESTPASLRALGSWQGWHTDYGLFTALTSPHFHHDVGLDAAADPLHSSPSSGLFVACTRSAQAPSAAPSCGGAAADTSDARFALPPCPHAASSAASSGSASDGSDATDAPLANPRHCRDGGDHTATPPPSPVGMTAAAGAGRSVPPGVAVRSVAIPLGAVELAGVAMREVAIPPGAILIQLADAAQVLSGGRLLATPHCVSRSGTGVGVSRQTFVLFTQPAWGCPLAPLPHTASPAVTDAELEGIVAPSAAFDEAFEGLVPSLRSRWLHAASSCTPREVAPTFAAFARATTAAYYGAKGLQARA
jgi:hypothetical protein